MGSKTLPVHWIESGREPENEHMQRVMEGLASAQPQASGETSQVREMGMGGFPLGLL